MIDESYCWVDAAGHDAVRAEQHCEVLGFGQY